MLAIDHVIIAVDDLDDAAFSFDHDLGISSIAGGRHLGHGTANRIIPLGDSYLELVAVVDGVEASTSPFGSYMQARLADSGAGPVALCLRTDDIAAIAARTGDRALPMTRTRPDGVELSWHVLALDAALGLGLPFFIEWHVPAGEHPGRAHVDHRAVATGVAWVELGGDAERLDAWLGSTVPEIRVAGGDLGVHRVGVHRVAVSVADRDPIVIG